MAINPCCMPLQRGVILMAIIDVIFAVGKLIVTALDFTTIYRESRNKPTESEKTVSIIVGILLFIVAIMGLLLSLRLYFGAKKRDIKNCRIWLIVKIILFFIDVISLIVTYTAGDEESDKKVSVLVVTIIILIYRVYMKYCVYCFIQELKMHQERAGFQTRLASGGTAAYPMGTIPPNVHQQPTVFVTATPNPNYPPPYGANNQMTGISNPNYTTTNNL
ncbi:uncharacterized protein LOC110860597 [Folsomia candida]|uniref:Uncharacterized protein n=1 Tax=Folsomia candida TaxID=158441 RepID=A0A226D6I9_FOLCA|nr:uncharacterized protein LOC110860597 [Folsomia candida]OXA40474.1 hypothetical protein Fcan01_24658 [Folsomia candida]